MSRPFFRCLYRKALYDQKEFDTLVEILKINMAEGHWTEGPCQCNPPCPAITKEECDQINARLEKIEWPKPGTVGRG